MLDWLQQHETLLWWLGISSIVTFIGTLLLVPWLVARIPEDYFHEKKRPALAWWQKRPAVHIAVLILRNVLGLIVLLAGVAMLVLPGQGIITIVLGLMLMTFPGKYRFERWLVKRKGVLRAINWIRAKMKRPPLVEPAQVNHESPAQG
ncbi:MAG: PGPGW domain-containing protein [Phycisphaeraceae bacterium]